MWSFRITSKLCKASGTNAALFQTISRFFVPISNWICKKGCQRFAPLSPWKCYYSGPAGGPSHKMQPFSSSKGGSWSEAFHAWTVETGNKASLFVSTVFCGEVFVKIWCHIQRGWSFSEGVGPRIIVLESQPGKQSSRLKRSREITTKPIAEWVQTTKILTKK